MPLPDYLDIELKRRTVAAAKQTISRPPVSFEQFKRAVYPRYEHAVHIAEIDKALMSATRYVETGGAEGYGFWIISCPPRHGKTKNVSQLYPPYTLGYHPDWRFILASYGTTLAHKNSRYARNLISSPRYQDLFPGIELAHDSQAVDAWNLQGKEGGLDAVGVGSGVTGKGMQIGIIDDPVRSRQDAESQTFRDRNWEWFTDDFSTRSEPYSAVIVISTRWHQDDLVGRLLKYQPDKWRELRLPAIALADDVIGRPEGAALWPGRFPIITLREIEKNMGDYSFAALYQQNPIPSEGGLFKSIHVVENMPEVVNSWRFWDLALSSKSNADFSVGLRLDQCADGHFYISDIARKRLDWGEVPEFMAQTMLRDGSSVPQGIESAGYMSRAVTDLNEDHRLRHYSIWGYAAEKDKFTRALAPAAKMAASTLHVLRAHWTDDFLDEAKAFPQSAHDDQVDALSGVWIMASENAGMDTPSELHYSHAGSIPGDY